MYGSYLFTRDSAFFLQSTQINVNSYRANKIQNQKEPGCFASGPFSIKRSNFAHKMRTFFLRASGDNTNEKFEPHVALSQFCDHQSRK